MPAITTYTTTPEVRTESGFQYNTNIQDSVFDAKRLAAFSIINSKVAMRYALPLSDNTGWDESPAKQTIAQIELLYASALILISEYGNEGIGTDKDGYRKKKEAEDFLTQIVKGDVLLLDASGKELETNANLNVAKTSRVAISGGVTDSETRKFTTSQRF